jgi:hypothetical protein
MLGKWHLNYVGRLWIYCARQTSFDKIQHTFVVIRHRPDPAAPSGFAGPFVNQFPASHTTARMVLGRIRQNQYAFDHHSSHNGFAAVLRLPFCSVFATPTGAFKLV